MKLYKRLWTKMAMAIVTLIIVIMSIVTYFSTFRNLRAQREEFRINMSRIAQQIASIRFAETEGWYIYQNWIDNIIASQVGEELVYIAIFDEKDSLTASTLNRRWLDLGNTTYFTAEEQAEIVSRMVDGQIDESSKADFDHVAIQIKYGNDYLGTVDVGFSLIGINDRIRRRLLVNLALLALFSFAGVLAAVMISHRITRPLNTLSAAILNVARGDLNQKVNLANRDEIGQLGDAFNTMTVGLQEKSSIEEFSRKLGFTYEWDKLLQLIISHFIRALDASRGLLIVFAQNDAGCAPLDAAAYPEAADRTLPLVPVAELELALRDQVMVTRSSLPAVAGSDWLADWPENTCLIPIHSDHQLLGLIVLACVRHGATTSSETGLFISTLAAQAGLAIENGLLLQELTQQERLKKELEIAREVQQKLLPTESPHFANVALSGVCIPAAEVGGDYFDFIRLPDERLGIVIADVSGKGTSAAFYMAELKGMITTLAQIYASPREVVLRINEKLYYKVDRRIFATMIYGILDTHSGRFDFVRTGHIALIVKRSRQTQIEFLVPGGIGLGLVNNDIFLETLEEKSVQLDPRDMLIFCTDGITEAMNASKAEFGETRLNEVLKRSDSQSIESLQKMILNELHDFVQDAPQHDDVTLVLAQLLERELE